MIGLNTFINVPLAIEMEYLQAIIPTMIIEYKNSAIISAREIEIQFANSINNQHELKNGVKTPVVVDILGAITKYSSWSGVGTTYIGHILRALDTDEDVSGIVLNIDSGGGMVSGTAELTNIIKNLQKPTISYTSGYQCSAALDIASGCDYHMASPYADLIGSIGTMLSYQDFSAMFEKWGAKIYNLYAPQSTEKNKELYNERLKVLADDFITRMKENYGPDLKDDGKVFKGKTYTPQEALAIGLIDELGTIDDALAKF